MPGIFNDNKEIELGVVQADPSLEVGILQLVHSEYIDKLCFNLTKMTHT